MRADGIELARSSGFIYTWDTQGKVIGRYRPGGPVERLFTDSRLIVPDGIAIGPDGNLYFTDPQFARSNGQDRTVRPLRVYKAKLVN